MNLLLFRKAAPLWGIAAALLITPAMAFAKCPGVHYGARDFGWNKPFESLAWPYYEKDRESIRLKNINGTDQIYINGCSTGEARNHRTFYLDPGTYRLTVKRNGEDVLSRQLSVANGRTMRLSVGDER